MHRHSIEASFDCSNQAGVPFYIDIDLVRCHSIEMLVLVTCNSFRVEHDHSIELNSSLLTNAGRIFKPDTRTLSPNPLFVKHNAASSRRPTSTLRLPRPLWIWVRQMFPGLRKTALHQRGLGRASNEAPGGGWVGQQTPWNYLGYGYPSNLFLKFGAQVGTRWPSIELHCSGGKQGWPSMEW
jgi:hypothetical protein